MIQFEPNVLKHTKLVWFLKHLISGYLIFFLFFFFYANENICQNNSSKLTKVVVMALALQIVQDLTFNTRCYFSGNTPFKHLAVVNLRRINFAATFSTLFDFLLNYIGILCTAWKVPKYRVFSGLYFPAFGLNTERYGVSLRIQSECGKTRTIKNSALGYFSRSDRLTFHNRFC